MAICNVTPSDSQRRTTCNEKNNEMREHHIKHYKDTCNKGVDINNENKEIKIHHEKTQREHIYTLKPTAMGKLPENDDSLNSMDSSFSAKQY